MRRNLSPASLRSGANASAVIAATRCTVAEDTTNLFDGSSTTKATVTVAATAAIYLLTLGTQLIPVVQGERYRGTIQLLHSVGAVNTYNYLVYELDASGAALAGHTGPTVTCPAGLWTEVAWDYTPVEPGCVQVRVGVIKAGAAAVGDVFNVARLGLLDPGAWFDTGTINCLPLSRFGALAACEGGGFRRNLFVNPSFETGVSNVAVYNSCTVTRLATSAVSGAYAAQVAAPAAGVPAATLTAMLYPVDGVQPGCVYSVLLSIRAKSGTAAGRQVQVQLDGYNAGSGVGLLTGGTYRVNGGPSQAGFPTITLDPSTSAWTLLELDGWTLPAGANRMGVQILTGSTAWTSGDGYQVDAVVIERAPTVQGPYFDGSLAHAEWDGTADASTSQAVLVEAGIPNWPDTVVQVDFTTDPNGPNAGAWSWVDVTPDVAGFEFARGRAYELTDTETGQGTLRLANADGKYTGGSLLAPLPMRAFRVLSYVDRGVESLAQGFVERWPTKAADPSLAWSDVVLVDGFATLAQLTLRSAYEQEVLADSPVAYFPLQEDSTATQASNLVDPTAPGIIRTPKLSGSTPGSAGALAFGGSVPLLDEQNGVALTVDAAAPAPGGQTIKLPPAAKVGVTAKWSVELWIVPPSNGDPTVPPPSGRVFNVGVHFVQLNRRYSLASAQRVDLTLGVNPVSGYAPYGAAVGYHKDSATTFINGTTNIADDRPHHLVLTYDGGAFRLYVDGVLQTITSGTFSFEPDGEDVWIGGGIMGDGYGYQPSTGIVSHVAVYQSQLLPARITSHYQAGKAANGWSGEKAGTRISRALGWVGWPGATSLDAGDSGLGPASGYPGTDLLSVVKGIGADDLGVVFVDRSGSLRFQARSTRMGTLAPVWVFGSDTAGGELPYTGGPAFDFDPTYVANDVQVAAKGATSRAVDTGSQQRYFSRSLPSSPLQLNVDDPNGPGYAAQWLLSRYKDPQLRVQTLVLDPSANPALWPVVRRIEVGDRVRVNHRDVNGTTSLDGFVEHVQQKADTTGDAASWTVEVQVSPLFADYWLLGALHTTVHTAVTVVGATSLVLDPLPDSATNPAEASLAPGQQLVLSMGDSVHQETVTVASVVSQPTAGVAGYSTVLVTFTAAMAHTHAAGDVVCEPLPAGVTDPTTYDARSVLGSTTLTAY